MPENIFLQYKDRLSGLWECVSHELHDSDAPDAKVIMKPHGDSPMGRVLISPKGWLSAQMMNPSITQKPLSAGMDWMRAPDAELADVARALGMYCGRMQLFDDGNGLYWRTKVEIASHPGIVGDEQVRRVRHWEEGGSEWMELRPEQDFVTPAGTKARAVLVWKKVEGWE